MARVQGLDRPPYVIRAQLISPLDAGSSMHLPDALIEVDADGRIVRAEAWPADSAASAGPLKAGVVDLRPMVVLPGLIDLHAHLPQLPNAGLGAGLDLLSWLQKYIFPLEQGFDAAAAKRLAPIVYRSLAAAGTTTALMYGAVYEDSLDASFAAAEEHGIRLVLGKVMMDRLRYDPTVSDREVLDLSLDQSQRLIERWHGRDGGRLRYAVTPRFAVSCTFDMLRESADLARATGTYWQTHLAEDRGEVQEVARLFPDARDYTDVYDRAGGLGPKTILAHCVHLSEREVARIAETGTRIAHCPASNMFLATSGAMALARYLEAGIVIGMGSDVAAGPELSIFAAMKAGAYTQNVLCTMLGERRTPLKPLEWLRLGTLEGARALGMENEIGSLVAGKEADFILVDPSVTAPVEEGPLEDPSDIVSRLMFRTREGMVRGAWVRGRRLAA